MHFDSCWPESLAAMINPESEGVGPRDWPIGGDREAAAFFAIIIVLLCHYCQRHFEVPTSVNGNARDASIDGFLPGK